MGPIETNVERRFTFMPMHKGAGDQQKHNASYLDSQSPDRMMMRGSKGNEDRIQIVNWHLQ